QSDGTGIDSEGTTALGFAYVQAAIDVDQYAVAAMQQIAGNGTMEPTGVSTSYSLDLGTVAQYATPLGAQLGVLNDVLGQSDLLAGSFSIAGAPEFTNAGFESFGPATEIAGLAAGQEDTNPVVVLSSATVGVFTETITLDPIGYNPSGYSGTLTPETVTITGTVVAAPPPTPVARVADAWGDVHLTTFDGLYYNFQAAGEFILSESTIPGDSFEIQTRMQPYGGSSSVSVNTMVGAQVGNDRVTFGIDRTDTVWIDGQGVSLSSDPVVTLADGTLEQTSADSYRLVWNTGEELDVTNEGAYLNVTVSLPNSDAGNVQGLLGNDNGNPANDLTLPGGAPIASGGTISYAQLYGTYETSWLVNQSNSLMDYGPGQDSASFYNANFPYNQIGLGNLPANAVQ
ncbi:MAG: VWD domain-containing protein, partial [Acetobacteraceae bacterium]